MLVETPIVECLDVRLCLHSPSVYKRHHLCRSVSNRHQTARRCASGATRRCWTPWPLKSPAHNALPHLTACARQTSDCQALYIRGYAPLLDPLATNATQLVVDVAAASVVDACGERFPGTSITTSVRSR